jgi:CRP-like cAMP-binding protein
VIESLGLLGRIPLFADLTPAELGGLRGCLRPVRYQKGETIFLTGDPGSGLYLIESGRVKIALTSAEGKEVILTLLGPADFFGDLALLDGEPRSADAVALDDCRAWLLHRDDFLHFVDTRPGVARKLLAVLSRRLRRNAMLLQEAAFHDVPGRLARLIVELAEQQGRPTPEGIVISSRLTQADLAGMVAATRESVNKWLRIFERRGLIRGQRGVITVLDLEALRDSIE